MKHVKLEENPCVGRPLCSYAAASDTCCRGGSRTGGSNVLRGVRFDHFPFIFPETPMKIK